MFLGQLSLDGGLRHTTGILPLVALAREQNVPTVVVPAVDAPEAALIEGVRVIPAPSLADLTRHLTGECPIAPFGATGQPGANGCSSPEAPFPQDLADVRGQEHARRALEVAAAGGHNLLLTGVPGAGKTLLARCLPSILPPLTLDEALEVTRVYSVCGLLQPEQPLIRQRPFRAPHHTISHAGLVGGGSPPRPGELSLAHRGVLFLDELPEFDLHTLETLRQPLEAGHVTIARARGAATFPSQVTLVAAMNPCPCGYFGDSLRRCVCSRGALLRYRRRLSGPLLDRIDMHLEVTRVPYAKLSVGAEDEDEDDLQPPPEPSAPVRARVIAARERQLRRFAGSEVTCNAGMGPGAVRRYARTDGAGEQLLRQATARLGLSARAYHRVLKLARTIADLDGKDTSEAAHVAEALQYRPRVPEA